MSTRERHAHDLHMAVLDAMQTMRREAFECGLVGCSESVGEATALSLVNARLTTLADFGAMCDADAELEFDPTPDTQEQVTTPREVNAR